MAKLSDAAAGKDVVISHVAGSGAFRARLSEMGFVTGKTVRKLFASPTGDPIVFELMGSRIALRRSEADNISTTGPGEEPAPLPDEADGTDGKNESGGGVQWPLPLCTGHSHAACSHCGCSRQCRPADMPARTDEITIALVGNPNCGKTSLFNAASGGHERTGNYSGVTVSSIVGQLTFEGRKIRLVDLPGTYSLRAFSPEEAYVARELESGRIDAVINVLDTTNLERNLLLTLQLQERNIPLVGALNIYDEFEESGSRLDTDRLSQRLGMDFVPTVARRGKGIDTLLRKATELADRHIALHRNGIEGHNHEAGCCHTSEHHCPQCGAAITGAAPCPCPERELEDSERYARIDGLLSGIYEKQSGRAARITAAADRILTHRWLAYPLFAAIMGFIFWATFTLGQYPMDWIDTGVAWLTDLCSRQMPEGTLRDLVCDGILGGVGSVIVFLPNILILYLFISLLEDSGYLARAAMLADPLLSRLGLHGKSFIPLLMGFGCNVPAVMATRTIENHKSRMITMLVMPLMSCSARIPVYVIFAGAFFPRHAVAVMLGLYLTGIVMALLAAWVLSRLFMRDAESHFVMELPPYRRPHLQGVLRHTWEKGRQYLHKMGGIILVASVVIWALGHFPRGGADLTEAQQQEQSYMGRLGHAAEPLIAPLGYDWRMGIGILAGVGAKELMVSTLGVLYNCAETEDGTELSDAEESSRLSQVLAQNVTPEAALSYMVFALLYFPCIATIAAIRSESGSWKRALLAAAYTTALAYVMAFAVYRLAALFF